MDAMPAPPSADPSPACGRPRAERLFRAARIYAIAAMAGVALAQTAPFGWPGECASHWTLHAAVLLAVLMPALRRRPRWLAAGAVAIVLAIWPWLLSWRGCAPPPPTGAAAFRLVAANVAIQNRDAAALAPALLAAEADVLAVIEASPPLVARLRAEGSWADTDAWLGGDASSIAVFSRLPVAKLRSHEIDGSVVLDLTVDWEGRPVRVLAVHPVPPVGGRLHAWSGRVLKRIAALAAASRVPVVVCGDLNCSPGSPRWRRLLADGGLAAARQVLPRTWPQPLRPLGIPLDHVLVGPDLALSLDGTLPLAGSDHAALVARVAWGGPPRSAGASDASGVRGP